MLKVMLMLILSTLSVPFSFFQYFLFFALANCRWSSIWYPWCSVHASSFRVSSFYYISVFFIVFASLFWAKAFPIESMRFVAISAKTVSSSFRAFWILSEPRLPSSPFLAVEMSFAKHFFHVSLCPQFFSFTHALAFLYSSWLSAQKIVDFKVRYIFWKLVLNFILFLRARRQVSFPV